MFMGENKTNKIVKYLNVSDDYQLPETMQAIVLSGTKEENLKLTAVEVPKCGDNEILARVDAVMACASDIKLIDQGPEHPLMYGWDTSKYPIIIGHEGAVTVVKVGKNLRGKYYIGQRLAVQPAVPMGPRHYRERYRNNAEGINKIAVGYTLPGLFAEYVLIPEEVIETGCLIPYPNNVPFFGAALAEPLSCVIASQEKIVHVIKDSPSSSRRVEIGPKRGGVTLIIGAGPMGLMHIEVAMTFKPSKIIVSELLERRRVKVREIFQNKAEKLGIKLVVTEPEKLRETVNEETGNRGVDDVIVALGIAKVQEEALEYLTKGGVGIFFGGTPSKDKMIQLDTHKVHYDGIMITGSSGSDPSDVARAVTLIANGSVDPGNYVVKCGGLDAAIPLMRAVRRQEIDGKGVIYPHTKAPLFDVSGWNIEKERIFLDNNLVSY